MDYLCSHCDILLSKLEMQLNEQFPIGKHLCEFCSNKKERQIIKQLADSEKSMHNDYTRDLLGGKIQK